MELRRLYGRYVSAQPGAHRYSRFSASTYHYFRFMRKIGVINYVQLN